jgi:hypothetical protein
MHSGNIPASIGKTYSGICGIKGKTEKSFHIALQSLIRFSGTHHDFNDISDYCAKIWSWASEEDLLTYKNTLNTIIVAKQYMLCPLYMHKAIMFSSRYFPAEMRLREMLKKMKWINASRIMKNRFAKSNQPGHKFVNAIIQEGLSNTNMAFKLMLQSYKKRCFHAEDIIGDNSFPPNLEGARLRAYSSNVETNQLYEYVKMLKDKQQTCVSRGQHIESNEIQQELDFLQTLF